MTRDQLDLARRLVARPEWRWVPGMLAEQISLSAAGRVLRAVDPRATKMDVATVLRTEEWRCVDCVPDLSDYATAAIILRMEWEAERSDGGRTDMRFVHPVAADIQRACNVAAAALLDLWGPS